MKKLPKKIKQYLKEYYKIIIVYIVILALFLSGISILYIRTWWSYKHRK